MPPSRAAGAMRFKIEGADLNAVYKKLRATEPKLAAALRKGIKDAAAPVVKEIKAEAEAQGLHRAAAATSVRFSSTKRNGITATIRTDHKAAPMARPLEYGSQGRAKSAGQASGGVNRHPVFAQVGSTAYEDPKRWVDQPTRPYFWVAIIRKSPEVGQRVKAALDAVFR
jgi:hypothetical protein